MPASWILVEWTDEDECSVIPSSWVKTPKQIPSAFPVKNAVCRWSDGKKCEASLLAVSDSKPDLEAMMEKESRLPSPAVKKTASGKRGARKRCSSSDAEPASKKRMVKATTKAKALQCSLEQKTTTAKTTSKTKKPALSAQGVTNDTMSTAIELAVGQLHSCKRCGELEEKLDDKMAATKAKMAQIEYLQGKLSETERKLVTVQSSSTCPPSTVTGQGFPVPSSDVLRYLEQLVSHFSSGNTSQHDDNITYAVSSDFESDFEEEERSYEAIRQRNIDENRKIPQELGFGPKEKHQTQGKEKHQTQGKEKHQILQESAAQEDPLANKHQLSPQLREPESRKEKDQAIHESAETSEKLPTLKRLTVKNYCYDVTSADLSLEQEAFEPGEGKKELFPKFGVYIRYIQLEQAEQMSRKTATGLMRGLISMFYKKEMLAACSATHGINSTIRTAIFKYCEQRYPGTSFNTMTCQLTSKCGEERRNIMERRKKEKENAGPL